MRSVMVVAALMVGATVAQAYRAVPPPPDRIRRMLAPADPKADAVTLLTGGEWILLNPDRKRPQWQSRMYSFTADHNVVITTSTTAGDASTTETWSATTENRRTTVTVGGKLYNLGPCKFVKTITVCLTQPG